MHLYPLVRLLQDSIFGFHLTGSRAFGKETTSSDWDFFVQNSKDVQQFLKGEGFIIENHSLYLYSGLLTTAVMRNRYVHVQLVKNVDMKMLAQELVAHWPGFKEVSKTTERLIWSACYDFILIVREHDKKNTVDPVKQAPKESSLIKRKIEWQGAQDHVQG